MINNDDNYDLYDLDKALKVENLTINDYEEICRFLENFFQAYFEIQSLKYPN